MSPEFTPKEAFRVIGIGLTAATLSGVGMELVSASETLNLPTSENPHALVFGIKEQANGPDTIRTLLFNTYHIQNNETLTQSLKNEGKRVSADKFAQFALDTFGASSVLASLNESAKIAQESGYKLDDISQGFEILADRNGEMLLVPTIRVASDNLKDSDGNAIPKNSLLAPFEVNGIRGIVPFVDQDGEKDNYEISFLILGKGALDPNTRALPIEVYRDPDTGESTPINILEFHLDQNKGNVAKMDKTPIKVAYANTNNLNFRDANGNVIDKLTKGTKIYTIDPDNKTYTILGNNAAFVEGITDGGEVGLAAQNLLDIQDSPVKIVEVPTEPAPGINEGTLIYQTPEPPSDLRLNDLVNLYDIRTQEYVKDFFTGGQHVGFGPFKLKNLEIYEINSDNGASLHYAIMDYVYKNTHGYIDIKLRADSVVGGSTAFKVEDLPGHLKEGNNYRLEFVLYPKGTENVTSTLEQKCASLPSTAKINTEECNFMNISLFNQMQISKTDVVKTLNTANASIDWSSEKNGLPVHFIFPDSQ